MPKSHTDNASRILRCFSFCVSVVMIMSMFKTAWFLRLPRRSVRCLQRCGCGRIGRSGSGEQLSSRHADVRSQSRPGVGIQTDEGDLGLRVDLLRDVGSTRHRLISVYFDVLVDIVSLRVSVGRNAL